jgi:hypothetical protein
MPKRCTWRAARSAPNSCISIRPVVESNLADALFNKDEVSGFARRRLKSMQRQLKLIRAFLQQAEIDQLVAGFDGDRLPIGRRSGLENLDDGNQR